MVPRHRSTMVSRHLLLVDTCGRIVEDRRSSVPGKKFESYIVRAWVVQISYLPSHGSSRVLFPLRRAVMLPWSKGQEAMGTVGRSHTLAAPSSVTKRPLPAQQYSLTATCDPQSTAHRISSIDIAHMTFSLFPAVTDPSSIVRPHLTV